MDRKGHNRRRLPDQVGEIAAGRGKVNGLLLGKRRQHIRAGRRQLLYERSTAAMAGAEWGAMALFSLIVWVVLAFLKWAF